MKFQNFSINLNTKCNFRCDYCFIPHSEKSGDEISYVELHNFRRFVHLYGEKPIQIDVFGTEPLISWDKLVHLMHIASSFRWDVGVTTNASLITRERAEFLAENKVGVLVSYDGSRRSHNRFRKFRGGQGTWQSVVKGIDNLDNAGAKYACAMVVSPENLPYLLHNVKSAAVRGFEYIALNPQFTVGREAHPIGYNWELLRQKYRQAAEWAIKHEVHLKFTLESFIGFNKNKELKPPSMATCGATKGSIAVDWDGQLYICHRGCGREEFKVGDLQQGPQPEIINAFRKRDINECHYCPIFNQIGACGHCWILGKDLTGQQHLVPPEVCMWQTIIHEIDLDLYKDSTKIGLQQHTDRQLKIS